VPKRSNLIEGLLVLFFLIHTVGIGGRFIIDPFGYPQVVQEAGGTSPSFSHSLTLHGDYDYMIHISVQDVQAQQAEVNGTLQVFLDSELVEECTLTAQEAAGTGEIYATVREEESVILPLEEEGELGLEWIMEKGDEWSIVIYRNPSAEMAELASAFTVIAIGGLILMLVFGAPYAAYVLGGEEESDRRPTWKEDEELEEELGVEFYD
jgi:hypothetical protein